MDQVNVNDGRLQDILSEGDLAVKDSCKLYQRDAGWPL